jgi:hypothetical protein
MISSVRNFSVRILDANRFTIVIFQILDIKSNYLPGIVHIEYERTIDPLIYVALWVLWNVCESVCICDWDTGVGVA